MICIEQPVCIAQAGNSITAQRILGMISKFAPVRIGVAEPVDHVMIALNAFKLSERIWQFKKDSRRGTVVVVVTGTDIYREGKSQATQDALNIADKIVLLNPDMHLELTQAQQHKASVIYQSAQRVGGGVVKTLFPRCVQACHMRYVKHPELLPESLGLLAGKSQIVADAYGRVLDDAVDVDAVDVVRAEATALGRWRWHGEVDRELLLQRITSAWMFVSTSRIEGAPSTISEAIVNSTPVMASAIPGHQGLLGHDYLGFFAPQHAEGLMEKLNEAERFDRYWLKLYHQVRARRDLFQPQREEDAWQSLLSEL